MLDISNKPVAWWFAFFIGTVAWLLALYCLFLALRFRLAPIPGDEEDIAVGFLSIYGSPLALASLAFAAVRSVRPLGKLLLALPCAGLIIAVLVASVGITGRP
jgi:hypothetical protein